MKTARDGLLALYEDSGNADARSRMAYAALISGITSSPTAVVAA
jgi:alcohol dehydrogenase